MASRGADQSQEGADYHPAISDALPMCILWGPELAIKLPNLPLLILADKEDALTKQKSAKKSAFSLNEGKAFSE